LRFAVALHRIPKDTGIHFSSCDYDSYFQYGKIQKRKGVSMREKDCSKVVDIYRFMLICL